MRYRRRRILTFNKILFRASPFEDSSPVADPSRLMKSEGLQNGS